MNNYCIISHKHKFIYFPIAKSGCTTLLNRIAEIIHERDIDKYRTGSHRDVHSKRRDIFNTKNSELCLDSATAINQYKDYFKFAFYRNPFDRVHSCYVDKLSLNTYGYDNNLTNRYPTMHRGMTFTDFLATVKQIPLEKMDEHFRPQYTFVNLDFLDFAGKLENINEDWHRIEKRFNLTPKILPQYNKTQEVDYYSSESEQLVRDIYTRDFELLHYSTTRITKSVKMNELPLTISADPLHCALYPFKDVFCEKESDCYKISVTGNDAKIIIPYFSIRNGMGVDFRMNMISPIETTLTLYFTTKNELESPECMHRDIHLTEGRNSLSIKLNEPDVVGRFRLKPSSHVGIFYIEKISIEEYTLPWLENKDDLTEINKKIFPLPRYTQNDKNLFSMTNFSSIYFPILEVLHPKNICEIGVDMAYNTAELANFCRRIGAELTLVDPVEPPDCPILTYPHVSFHKKHSDEFFDDCDKGADVYFIDGDHNYRTVRFELEQIDRLAKLSQCPVCLFLHDTSWPWAYRDLYYDPERLHVSENRYVRDKGVSITSDAPVEDGLPSPNYAVSAKEGGEKNGVKKAVEDFLEKYAHWQCCSINSLYGLTILWIPERLDKKQKAVFDDTRSHFKYFETFLNILEWNRLSLLCHKEKMANVWNENQRYIKQLQEQNKEYRKRLEIQMGKPRRIVKLLTKIIGK